MGRIAVAAIISCLIVPVSILVGRVVPDPYMDEIFHIPQAQQYCKGNFSSWDPMITTPPGLYYISVGYAASLFPISRSSFAGLCTTTILRSTNHVLAVICGLLFFEITTHLRPALDRRKATLYAVVLALYPLHWFFTFLYYTDVASLAAVLAMYLACLKKHYKFSSLLGAFAVFIRQTNIVWMLFVACTGVVNSTLVQQKEESRVDDMAIRRNGGLTLNKYNTVGSSMRKRKLDNNVDVTYHTTLNTSTTSTAFTPGLLGEIQAILFTSWHLKSELLVSLAPFFVVFVAFAAFVYWNGSVVLGAKEAHAVSPHFAQVLYFSLVSALAMAPLHFNFGQAAKIFQSMWKNRPYSVLLGFLAFIAGFLSVHFFSIAHPYLLADNRHYPFYLWRKIIRAHWSIQYILVPLYIYSWFSICNILGKVQRKAWVLVYFLATAAVLVPAPLIEFRYYTIPFYFIMLHSPIHDYKSWVVMGILYVAVNAFTMTMFLFRPFCWEHEPGVQRFIW